ncbi:MAG TPA: hypothetical protein VL593_13780 [Ramlibacter sp.]|jgi:hypothetical protein|nr:hypothetical protein [Ramlibacter sp.]
MSHVFAHGSPNWNDTLPPSLEAGDEVLLVDETRYCPMHLLDAFALLMAGHGRSICTSMMLGDREYAMCQLARAHTLADAQLREIAARLFDYFHDEKMPVPVGMRG